MTLAVKRAFAMLKLPPVLFVPAATVVVTVAVPTPTGVTVTGWPPAVPQAARTRREGETVATAGLSTDRSTVTVSLVPSKLQPGSPSPSAGTT